MRTVKPAGDVILACPDEAHGVFPARCLGDGGDLGDVVRLGIGAPSESAARRERGRCSPARASAPRPLPHSPGRPSGTGSRPRSRTSAALSRHTAVSGSMGACARYGNSNSPSTRMGSALERRVGIAAGDHRDRLLAASHGAVLASSARVVLRFSAPDSSQVTCERRAALLRRPHVAADDRDAARNLRPRRPRPGTAFALAASNDCTLPPKRGGRMHDRGHHPREHHVDRVLLRTGRFRARCRAAAASPGR